MSPYATPSLLAAVGSTQLLFGTDFAARSAGEVGAVTAALDRDPHLDRHTRRAIDRSNALRLLPRLAERLTG